MRIQPHRNLNRPRPRGSHEMRIALGSIELTGTLSVPPRASALVILPHVDRPGRRGHNARRLAASLHARRFATFSVDLRTDAEARRHLLRDDVAEIARRLVDVTDWIRSRPPVSSLPIGYVAADASPAALMAATARPEIVRAVVSWGGHPELAVESLPKVEAAALLLAPARDPAALEQNRHAIAALFAPGWVEVVPGTATLDEDNAHLDDVARRASDWFSHHAMP